MKSKFHFQISLDLVPPRFSPNFRFSPRFIVLQIKGISWSQGAPRLSIFLQGWAKIGCLRPLGRAAAARVQPLGRPYSLPQHCHCTERCKFVRAKLRESAASHSQPQPATPGWCLAKRFLFSAQLCNNAWKVKSRQPHSQNLCDILILEYVKFAEKSFV